METRNTPEDRMAAWSRQHRALPPDLYTSDLDAIFTASGRLIEGAWMSFFDRKPYLLYDLDDGAEDRHIRRRAMRDLADRVALPCCSIDWRERGDRTEYLLVAKNERGLAAIGDKRRIMNQDELVAWHYALRGCGPQAARRVDEHSDWRDDLATRFRAWEPGDLGDSAEEDAAVVAVAELKRRDYSPFDFSSAQVAALSALAQRAGIHAIAGGYQHSPALLPTEEQLGHTETWDFVGPTGIETEREFVTRLWSLRGAVAPAEMLEGLAGRRRRTR
jgi:hypothetical protein